MKFSQMLLLYGVLLKQADWKALSEINHNSKVLNFGAH